MAQLLEHLVADAGPVGVRDLGRRPVGPPGELEAARPISLEAAERGLVAD